MIDTKLEDCKTKISLLNNKTDWLWMSLKQFTILFNYIQSRYMD